MKLEVNTKMNLSKLKYSFSQAKKNFFRNGLMTIASLFTITCCLLILGLFTVISLNVNYITNQVKGQCEVQVYMFDGTSDERIKSVGDEILAISNVKEAKLFTRQDAMAFAVDDMFGGDATLVEGLADDTFRDSYKVNLVDIELTAHTVEQLSDIADVETVSNKQDVVNLVVSLSDAVKKVTIIAMVLLLVIALVIMSNTIRLTVFNRRKEINIMKYIGATDRFIRVPFIMEGVMIGVLGAVIAFGFMSWGYLAVLDYATNSMPVFDILSYARIAPVCGILFVMTGGLIGMVGSMISMRKYLNV